MMVFRVSSLIAVSVLLLAPRAASAQAAEMGAPRATSAEGFTYIYGAVQLPDGRVLLTDSREQAIVRLDLAQGIVERIERHGRGPREFLSAYSILPRPDGSFAVYDALQRRFSIVSPDGGEIEDALSFVRPPIPGFGAPHSAGEPAGALYVDQRRLGRMGLERAATVYRWDPKSGDADSLGAVMQYSRGQEGRGAVPMPLGDAWSILPDGTFVRIVGDDYHVEWSTPGGSRGSAPPVPYQFRATKPEDRERWVRDMLARPAGGARLSERTSAPTDAETRTALRRIDIGRFPKRVPPFEVGYAPSSPQGHVWLGLTSESDSLGTTFDILGRSGQLIRRVRVSGVARVVGFGRDCVFLAVRDDVDLEWLVEYAYPIP